MKAIYDRLSWANTFTNVRVKHTTEFAVHLLVNALSNIDGIILILDTVRMLRIGIHHYRPGSEVMDCPAFIIVRNCQKRNKSQRSLQEEPKQCTWKMKIPPFIRLSLNSKAHYHMSDRSAEETSEYRIIEYENADISYDAYFVRDTIKQRKEI